MVYKTYFPFVSTDKSTSIHIACINNVHEPFALHHVESALFYWNELSPISPRFIVSSIEHHTELYPFKTHTWIQKYKKPYGITVVVINNEEKREFVDLGGGITSPAWNWPHRNVLYVTTHTRPPYGEANIHDFLGMATAHELGHARYNLPDRYNIQGYSIMTYPLEAYRRRVMHELDIKDIIAYETNNA